MPCARMLRRSAERSTLILVATSLALAACTATDRPVDDPGVGAPLLHRPFSADSWWNTPVPANAPTNPDAAAILDYMQHAPESGGGCARLAGATNGWGQPVYYSQPGDPVYDVTVASAAQPPELQALRIPADARSAPTSDAAMTVYDAQRGYVVALTGASFDSGSGSWTARGATVTYLDSNGLHVDTGASDDPRNVGSHRGNNGATMMVEYDEVAAGAIQHVLKVASGPEVSRRHVFPMIGSDGTSTASAAPPEGLRFRIKPEVDLGAWDLNPEARIIAQALQTYGFYIGDSGGVTALKLENTEAAGRGQLWQIPSTALCALPISSQYWDVLPEGYYPGRGD